jgi:hypothetical protein
MNEHDIDQAKHRVILGELRMAHQEIIVAQLKRDGHDATKAHELLASFQDDLAQVREYLRKLLDGE